MTKSFDEIVSNYQDPQPEWTVTINGKDYSNNIELIEFTDSVNNPLKITVKLEGIDSNDNIPEDAEIVIGRKSAQLFEGVLKEVNPNALNSYTFKGTGYAAELESNSEQILSDEGVGERFEDATVQTVVDTLVDGASMPNSKSFSTSYTGNVASTVVDDFRVKKKQIEDVNRLMGEYDIEWYTTSDGSNNPVFNVTDQISFTDGGSPLDTITTYGGNQSAEMVEQNVNRNKGDFDGVVVRGYGDGDDQITASAGSTGKGNRVLFYTDKTIVTSSQAQKRADNLADTQTIAWQEIEVKPSNPNKIYGVGDELKIESEEARLNDTYRVVKSYFKIWPGEDQFESKLNLNNKPQTFIDDFKEQQNQTDSETDYMQGARNIWSDKEAANATNAEPLKIDFEVPQDVVDVAGNNRLDRIEFNYACTPFQDTGDSTTVNANNFDPSTKVVGTDVEPAGVQMERSNIKQHNHPVASSTSQGANTAQQREIRNIGALSINGWTIIDSFSVDNPEKDLDHTFEVELTSIDATKDMHFAVLGDLDTGGFTPSFEYSPSNPGTGDTVTFEDTTDTNHPPFFWHWRIVRTSDNFVEASGFKQSFDHRFEFDSALTYPVDYEVELIVNSANETDILSSDSGANTFTVSGDVTSNLRAGDSVKVLGSDGNNGAYTIESFTTDGNNDTVITTVGGVDFSYSSGDSRGRLQHLDLGSPNSATATVTVSNNSSLTVAKSVEDNEFVVQDLPSGNDWEVFTPNNREVFTVGSVDFNNDIEDSGESDVDVEFFLQKVPESGVQDAGDYFGWVDEETSVDVDFGEFVTFDFDFDDFDDYPFEESFTEGEYDGAPEGRYSFSYRYTDSTGAYVFNVERIFYIVLVEPDISNVEVDPDGDDSSEVAIDIEGYHGALGGDRVELEIDGNTVYEGVDLFSGGSDGLDPDTSSRPDIGLFELEEGETRTVTIEGSENTVENAVANEDSAALRVNGILDSYDEEDALNDLSPQPDEYEFRLKNSGTLDIIRRDGSDFGTTWRGAVIQPYIDHTVKESGLSDGDHTATLTFYDENFNEVDSDSDTFTISLNDPPSADFAFTPSSPSVEDTIYFEDLSTDPDGNSTITKWEWDFGDGTTETINSSPGDTDHKYSSTGNYSVTLTVTDDQGATDDITKTVSVGGSFTNLENADTKAYESMKAAGGAPSAGSSSLDAQLTSSLNNPTTKSYESVAQVGSQQTPDGKYMDLTLDVNSREVSDSYEVIATTVDGSTVNVNSTVEFYRSNHTHKMPRQDDFDGTLASVGAGAENKEVEYVRAESDRGDVLLDFSTNNEAVTLDTTLNGNDVEVTVANIDEDGNLSNSETISANNGTATTTNTYQDSELYISIDAATDKQEFEVRDQSFEDRFTLAAASQGRFRSGNTKQTTEGVSLDDGSSQEVVTGVGTGLVAGSQANYVKIFIDDDPDTVYDITSISGDTITVGQDVSSVFSAGDDLAIEQSSANNNQYTVSSVSSSDITVNESIPDDTVNDGVVNKNQDITGALYGGSPNSGTAKDKELDLSSYVTSPGWYRLKVEPDQPSFIKSRVFLDHHKDTQ